MEIAYKDLINCLAVIIKTAQIHHINNVTVTNAINKLIAILTPLLSETDAKLELVGEFFHLNGNRVKYSMDSVFNYDFLVGEFRKRDMGSINFENVPGENDIKTFIEILLSHDPSKSAFEEFAERVSKIPNISVKRLQKIREDSGGSDRKKIIKRTYFNAVSLTKGISNKIKSGEKINLRGAKRVMEKIVDHIITEESMLLGMTTIKDYDEYTYFHSVNVSVLSIALGNKIGLTKKNLTELGLAALLHDIGKIEIPIDILNKTTEFTEKDWEIVMKHPMWGAVAILKLKGIDALSMGSVITAFEHHLNFDLSGYPKLKNKLTLNLFSKIISIADQYDAMTSSRVYARIPIPPDKALSIMVERSGTQIDPHMLKIFINMLSIYPIGSLVMLDTREMGIVFESNTKQGYIDRPRVLILVDSSGNKTKDMADLTEKNQEGLFKRNIIRTLDPNQYKINLSDYLL